jgi:hypothetical protein
MKLLLQSTYFSGILSQSSLRMRESGLNSTSSITFDIINELGDPDFLIGGVIFPKLRPLV